MKTIQIGEKTINVLTKLNEISLKKFENCINILNSSSYEFKIDKSIDVLAELSTLTKEEIEEMEIDLFETTLKEIEVLNFEATDYPFINEVNINGRVFRTHGKDNTYKFKLKEMLLIEDIIKTNEDAYICKIAAVLFRPIDQHNEIINDYSAEGLAERKDLFGDNLNMDIFVPYLNLISDYFINKTKNA